MTDCTLGTGHLFVIFLLHGMDFFFQGSPEGCGFDNFKAVRKGKEVARQPFVDGHFFVNQKRAVRLWADILFREFVECPESVFRFYAEHNPLQDIAF